MTEKEDWARRKSDGDEELMPATVVKFILQLIMLLLIFCELELIKLQKNCGEVKVMMVGMILCNCRWIGGLSEEIC